MKTSQLSNIINFGCNLKIRQLVDQIKMDMDMRKFIIFYSIRFLQLILAVTGNAMTIISIAKFENLQTSTHFL